MKKEVILACIFVILVLIFVSYKSSVEKQVTGNSITGNATSAGVAISITITGPPTLQILRPENETYFTTKNLELNFTALSANSIWYNLDSGANNTITSNTTFNTTEGLHTLYLWANNSDGNASKNVTFTINSSAFQVIYANYKNNGSSTDFNSSSYEDMQNLSGIVLERTAYGKIAFNQVINLTNGSTPTDGNVDLNSHTNISYNFTNINTTALPNLNKSATISFYGLTFSNPLALRNGEACSSEICTEVSYAGGTFIFNVTQFSNYSADETPASDSGAPVGGGGVGGSGSEGGAAINFTVDREQISINLQPGQVKTENITITNTGKNVQVIEIENLLKEFIVRSEDAIVLSPGESRVIELHAIARIDTVPDIYLGKLIVSTGNMKKEILIAIEIESKDLLLDVRAEILEPYKRVLVGEEILSEIRLFNLGGDTKRKDVEIEYIIKDYNNKTITSAHESLAIETQVTFIKRFDIPEGTNQGDYIFYVRAMYEDKIASSSDTFRVVSTSMTIIWYIMGGILIVIFLIWLILKILRGRFGRKLGGVGISDYRTRLRKYK